MTVKEFDLTEKEEVSDDVLVQLTEVLYRLDEALLILALRDSA